MLLPLLGSLSLGFVMGWLMRYCLIRFKRFDAKVLGSVASVICGGAVLKLFQADPFSVTVWGYPIGLAIGVVSYPLVALFENEVLGASHAPAKKSRSDSSKVDPDR
jgi:hypothetical protein